MNRRSFIAGSAAVALCGVCASWFYRMSDLWSRRIFVRYEKFLRSVPIDDRLLALAHREIAVKGVKIERFIEAQLSAGLSATDFVVTDGVIIPSALIAAGRTVVSQDGSTNINPS